ncbi:MAG: hypothetical protein LKG25_01805 [Prevotella sp.]|jgi:hypothetical protein|nr:hypothetical protein [Prevotella sp.]MCI1281313.1 hypothetical protein [Prevotella sp.]
MKEKTFKQLRRLCYVALFLCFAYLIAYCISAYYEAFGISEKHVQWEETRFFWFHIIFFFGSMLSSLSIAVLCIFFVRNILKGIKQQILFPKGNIRILYAIAIMSIFTTFFFDNENLAFQIMGHQREIVVCFDTVAMPIAILIFALMYKIGNTLFDENRLTI